MWCPCVRGWGGETAEGGTECGRGSVRCPCAWVRVTVPVGRRARAEAEEARRKQWRLSGSSAASVAGARRDAARARRARGVCASVDPWGSGPFGAGAAVPRACTCMCTHVCGARCPRECARAVPAWVSETIYNPNTTRHARNAKPHSTPVLPVLSEDSLLPPSRCRREHEPKQDGDRARAFAGGAQVVEEGPPARAWRASAPARVDLPPPPPSPAPRTYS